MYIVDFKNLAYLKLNCNPFFITKSLSDNQTTQPINSIFKIEGSDFIDQFDKLMSMIKPIINAD
jgi:hypothetical protein